MKDTRLKVGVVGLGKMGLLHLQKYLQLPDVEVVGVYDINTTRLEMVRQKYGVGYLDFSDLIFEADAVSIASSTESHHSLGKQALVAGVHCLIEKPLTLNLSDASELDTIASQNGLVLQVGFLERYRLRHLLKLIEPCNADYVEIRRMSVVEPREAEVNVVNDLMIHDLDLVSSIMTGEPASIRADAYSISGTRTDYSRVELQFPNGKTAVLSATYCANAPSREMLWVADDVFCHFDLLQEVVFQKTKAHRYGTYSLPPRPLDGVYDEVRDFVDSIYAQRRPLVGAADGLRAQALCDKITTQLKHTRQDRTVSIQV